MTLLDLWIYVFVSACSVFLCRGDTEITPDGVLIPEHGHEWGYYYAAGKLLQPDDWHRYWDHCDGKGQSPIDIIDKEVSYDADLLETPLKFINYDHAEHIADFVATNTGHSVSVRVDGLNLHLEGGGLKSIYHLAQLHLHWGRFNNIGSEHWINGEQFPAEIHFVHEQDGFTNLTEATYTDGGLAVVGVLIQIGEEENDAFENLLHLVENVPYTDSPAYVTTKTFPLDHLIPENTESFYRYHGSLTTPPCSEVVIWTVLHDTITVTKRQLETLRNSIHHKARDSSTDETKLHDNFRKPQKLYDREVYASVPMNQATPLGARGHYAAIFTILIMVGVW